VHALRVCRRLPPVAVPLFSRGSARRRHPHICIFITCGVVSCRGTSSAHGRPPCTRAGSPSSARGRPRLHARASGHLLRLCTFSARGRLRLHARTSSHLLHLCTRPFAPPARAPGRPPACARGLLLIVRPASCCLPGHVRRLRVEIWTRAATGFVLCLPLLHPLLPQRPSQAASSHGGNRFFFSLLVY
jgi:hypothetical protein